MTKEKFYTRQGDAGTTTRLGSQQHLPKHHLLMHTIGDIDEANSAIGMLRSTAQEPILKQALPHIQRRLIQVMAHLSATPEARKRYPGITDKDVIWLESLIAQLETLVPDLQNFVLPGDSLPGAMAHLARTIVRRAERQMVALAAGATEAAGTTEATSEHEEEVQSGADIGKANLAFINRLSSLMFVAAIREDTLLEGNISS